MPDGREYEITFTFEPRDAELIVSHPTLRPALADRKLTYLISTYFDTPDRLLRDRRIGLRVRRSDTGVTQTLKSSGASRIDRGEWELPNAGPHPDARWLLSTPLREVFEPEGLVAGLEPQFTVEVARTTLPIRQDGTEIEVAMDQGAIRGRGLSLPINDLELELKGGPADGVFALARSLVRDLPLTLSMASKAERGNGVIDLTWGKPATATPARLDRGATNAIAFEALVQSCLHALLVNAALVKGNDNVGAVHKTRIASRQLRAVFQLFRPTLDRERTAAPRADLKWIAKRLGDARDADVLQASFSDKPANETGAVGAPILAEILRSSHEAAYQRLHKALASKRWRLMLLDLLAASSDALRPAKREERFQGFVKGQLAKRRRTLAKRAKDIAGMPANDRHDLRKRAKMLRYDLELLEDTPKLASKRLRRLKKRLHKLQETLGSLQDNHAMLTHIRDLVEQPSPPAGLGPDDWARAKSAGRLLLERLSADAPTADAAEDAARELRSDTC